MELSAEDQAKQTEETLSLNENLETNPPVAVNIKDGMNQVRKLSMNAKKRMTSMKKQMEVFLVQQRRQRNFIKRTISELEGRVGKEDSAQIKAIAMISIPEQTNDAGEVIAPASTQLDINRYVNELRMADAINKINRVIKGGRKSSSGSRNQRKALRSNAAFIVKRAQEAGMIMDEETAQPVVNEATAETPST